MDLNGRKKLCLDPGPGERVASVDGMGVQCYDNRTGTLART